MSAAVTVLLSAVLSGVAQPPDDAIRYRLTFPDAATHYVDVEARFPSTGRDAMELMMAVWTPGSYLVREYARHVEALAAAAPDGRTLAVTKVQKNRWTVRTGGADAVVVRYRAYGREMSVRANWIERDFAVLNGAATFLTAVGHEGRSHVVDVALTDDWSHVVTALEPDGGASAGTRPRVFRARDYDALVDSPMIIGRPIVSEFTIAGRAHTLAHLGDVSRWDVERASEDVAALVSVAHAFWGELPYDRYVFLNVLSEGRGGLEHSGSTLLMTSRWTGGDPSAYREWLGLVSHELFHAWNGKRLRPVSLGPFDYETENHTRSLWIVEGLTSYYGDLLQWRASRLTDKQYFETLTKRIESLQETPGRSVQSVADASFDAWLKLYRRDENTDNTTISYYTKGAVIGFLLDARIRRESGDRRSLDDVMREAYRRYSGDRGYAPADFLAVVREIAGDAVHDWLATTIAGTDELSYEPALAWYGLVFRDPDEARREQLEQSSLPDVGVTAWLGAETRAVAGRVVVAEVPRGTPAHESGVNVDDELLALGGYRIEPDTWPKRLRQYRSGDSLPLLLARRGRIIEIGVTLGSEPLPAWKLALDPGATEAQQRHLTTWRGRSE